MAEMTAGQQQNAIAGLTKTFENYGLGSLASRIAEFIYQGYTEDTVSLLLQDAPEYKQRFSANDARVKAGLPVLSPREYLATESSYRAILQNAGLPKGFYDNQSDFERMIAGDVSATELKQRVDSAVKAIDNTDPYYKQALQNLYGLDAGHMVAHLLDPEVAAPLVAKQAKAVEYGAAAARQGLSMGTVGQYEQYATTGTGVGAEQGMQTVAEITPGLQTLGQISGRGYNQQTAEEEVFGGLASAKRAREQLAQEEKDRFTGRSNVESKSLTSDTSGLL